MEKTAERKWALALAILTIVYGMVVATVYLVGWIAPRTCEGLSALPCFVVAGWYGGLLGRRHGTPLHRWGWLLLLIGWSLVGLAFLLPATTGRWVALSSAVPTLLAGFGTTLLANWYAHVEEGGTQP